jgi:hypothetical protein
MSQIIVYPTDSGCCILYPTGELPIETVARKDVPQGIAYKFLDSSELPQDREFRNAWEVEIDIPDGYGDPDGYWVEQKLISEEKENKRGPNKSK